MHRAFASALCLLTLTASAAAQVIGIDDLDPATGSSNSYPFNFPSGQTSLHVYSAATLLSLGVCPGSVLVDLAVAPSIGAGGTYSAPQARLTIGHLSVNPPVPGAWANHLTSPVVVHDLSSGPYSFSWTQNTYVSLPGVAAAGFVWDGVRDIGIEYTSSSGVTGAFNARRTNTQLRHFVGVFQATTQTPTSNGLLAMEVRMTWAPGPNCANRTAYGAGCYDSAYTFYERFPSLQVFDLGGASAAAQVMYATSTPNGFGVAAVAGAWTTPTGTQVLSNVPTPTPMGNDTISQPLTLPFVFAFPGGSTSVVQATSNGYVLLRAAAANVADPTPTTNELVSQAPRLCPLWCDLDPTANTASNPASGIYFEVDPSNQAATITWLDVGDGRGGTPVAGTTSVNVQCVLHADGDFEYRYGTVLPSTNAGEVLVGWSQGDAFGGTARDLGSIDLSVSVPFSTGADSVSLKLDSTYPRLGTTFVLTTSDVPSPVPLAFQFFGNLQLPGIDLTALGAPGCSLYSNGNLTTASIPVVGGIGTISISLPNNPLLVGITLSTQSSAFTPANALHLVTSNGLWCVVGN